MKEIYIIKNFFLSTTDLKLTLLNLFKIIENLIFLDVAKFYLNLYENLFISFVKKLYKNTLNRKGALIGVKKSLHRKYGFMVLPEKVVNSSKNVERKEKVSFYSMNKC